MITLELVSIILNLKVTVYLLYKKNHLAHYFWDTLCRMDNVKQKPLRQKILTVKYSYGEINEKKTSYDEIYWEESSWSCLSLKKK